MLDAQSSKLVNYEREKKSHVVTGDIILTYFSSSDLGRTSTILTAMISRVQS